MFCFDDGGRTGYLHHHLVQGHLGIERAARTEDPIFSDHAALDGPTTLKLDDARKYTAVREVDILDPLPALGDDAALRQLNVLHTPSKIEQIDRANSGQNMVFGVRQSCAPAWQAGAHLTLSYRRPRAKSQAGNTPHIPLQYSATSRFCAVADLC